MLSRPTRKFLAGTAVLLLSASGALVMGCEDGEAKSDRAAGWCCPEGVTSCSCPSDDDTCSGGQNMSAPRVEGAPETLADGTGIRIRWDVGSGVGATLPATYFDGAKVVATSDGGASSVVRVTRPAERELLVVLKGTPAELAHQEVGFTLGFPDRRTAISCRHPGMEDRYLLDVRLSFGADGAIATSELEEKYSPGDI